MKTVLLAAAVLLGVALATLVALMERTRAGSVQTGIPMELDRFLPVYDFHEVHTIAIRASPARVFEAIREVTPDEISLFRTLTAIRGVRTLPKAPLLAQMLQGNVLLADVPEKEIVVGLIGRPWVIAGTSESPRIATPEEYLAFRAPGFAKMAFNLRVELAAAGEVKLLTETRVLGTDAAAGRKFTLYWTVIYPGSSLIREMWLSAIRRRAEQPRGQGADVERRPE